MMADNVAKTLLRTAGIYLAMLAMISAAGAAAEEENAKKDVKETGAIQAKHIAWVEKHLSDEPFYFGRPISDRETWEALAAKEGFKHYIPEAEKLIDAPIEPLTEEMYMSYFKTGRRDGYPSHVRRHRAIIFAMAECLENKGRFIEPFKRHIRAICDEPTWVIPPHDTDDADNYYGRKVDIELFSALWGWQLATCDRILADRLDAETHALIRGKLHQFILDPIREMVLAHRPENAWMRTDSNWNAVCWCGVTGTALAALEEKSERAFFVEAARSYIRYFLEGFPTDGYCTEGVGYWNFGYGQFVRLAEMAFQATHGKLDMFAIPDAQQPASFPMRIEILNGIYPSFADCSVNVQPEPTIMTFVNRRFRLGFAKWNLPEIPVNASVDFPTNLMMSLPNSATALAAPADTVTELSMRSWFDQAGILIDRPKPNTHCILAAAIKGGNNGENHNHNDNGSFIVVADKEVLLADPGSEVYTRRTFSSHRYDSKVLNSWGHSTPVVAGQLQMAGRHAYAKVVHLDFTDKIDTITYDLRPGYDVIDLSKLERTFIYDRRDKGSLTVKDRAVFTQPESFEIGLITFGSIKRMPPNAIIIQGEHQAVRIDIDTDGKPFELHEQQIEEEVHTPHLPTRVGIALSEPQREARIAVHITPIAEKTP